MSMRFALILVMVPVLSWAECVLQDRTVSKTQVQIAETSNITTNVVPEISGGRRCLVDLRARVGATWYTGHGEYIWLGDRSRDEACAVAAQRAQDSVRERVGSLQTVSEKILICQDNPDLNNLRSTNPGTIGDLSQFRPHPDFTKEFWHNGTKCRWFLDTAFVARDVRTYQGIICQLQDSKWVVVDKF